MENYSLSDIAAVTNGIDGNFNGSWILILLFAMIFGYGGNGFGRNSDFGQYATAASQQEILFGQQFQGLDNKIDKVGYGICDSTYALNNSITTEGRNLQNQLATAACENQRNVDSVRFDMANYASAIQANDTANTQKILDAISQNKIETLQGQINQLQLQNAMCGVVRYPNGWTYNAGTSPFCQCNTGCGCGNI